MAEIPQMPRTMKETVTAIWYTLHNGMTKEIAETHELAQDTATRVRGIEEILPNLWTREQHEHMHEEYVAGEAAKAEKADEKKDRRGLSLRDWLMLAAVVISIWAGPWITHLLEGAKK
jgi:hypothetical protein